MKKLFPILGLLLAGLLYLGCSEDYPTQSSDDQESVAAADLGLFAGKGKPGGGNGGGDPDPTYNVTINVTDFGYGEAVNAPSKGFSIGEVDMDFTFDPGLTCTSTPEGPVGGILAISVRQNRRERGPFTYGQATLWELGIDGLGALEFDIDQSKITPETGYLNTWPPADGFPVTLTGGDGGDGGDLEVWNRKAHDCTGTLPNHWTITVTRNPAN